jgi:hypothetical protein
MKKEFRILLIDDNKEVLDNLQAIIQRPITVENSTQSIVTALITVETLHVVLEQLVGGTEYQVTDSTIEKLAEICNKKFDFIFSDFAFIGDISKNESLRNKLLAERRGVREDDLNGWFLQLKDIKKKVDNLILTEPVKYKHINENFLMHSNIVHIYTFSPDPFSNYFDSYEMPKRKNEAQRVFSNAKIEFILMHDEFSIKSNIEELFSNYSERKRYYSLLLSKRLTSLIETVILKYMVIKQRSFLFESTRKGQGQLIKLGLGLGAFSAVFGEMLFHFLEEPLIITGKAVTETDYIFNYKDFFGSIAIFLVLTFACYKILQRFAVYVAFQTEKIAKELTINEE